MATNNFNSDADNDFIVPLQTFNDGSGLARLDNLNISSYAFDGAVPNTTVNLIAASITPGMKISLTGSALGETFYKVISNTASDSEIEDNETGNALIQYLDLDRNIQSLTASVSDIFSVNYEDWNNKYIGTKGWYLSNDGNAIFSNVAVRGRIEATDGKIEDLTIGSNSYSIINIVGVNIPSASVTGDRGSFILTTDVNQKLFYPGDNGRFENVVSSGSYFLLGSGNISSSSFFSEKSIFYVVTASYNFSGAFNRYYCNVSETGLMSMRNLGGLTASSGTYTFGPMEFGEIQTYSLTKSDTIEGFIFKTVGPGSFWDSYIPDYLDVSGRFRLGGGRVTFNGSTLSVIGDIQANSGSFNGSIYAKGGAINGNLHITNGGQIYIGANKDAGQRVNIRSTDVTGYTELGYPTFSLVTGSGVSASPLLTEGGFDGLPNGPITTAWSAYWGFEPSGGGHRGTVDSKFYKNGGKSFKISASAQAVSALTQDVSQLIGGEEYIFSAWVYSSIDLRIDDPISAGFVHVWFLSASYNGGTEYFISPLPLIQDITGITEIPANTWTKLTSKFIVPGSPYVNHRLDLRTLARQSASVWWDSVEVTQVPRNSTIGGFIFNDGEFYSDNIKILSSGRSIYGAIATASAIGIPSGDLVKDVLVIDGSHPSYRLWSGNIDPALTNFSISKSGRITSSATYHDAASLTANVHITNAGVFRRNSSTQRIKCDIIPFTVPLSTEVDPEKIINEPPSVDYRKVLDISPVQFKPLEGEEVIDRQVVGFIAEDIADKFPELASYDRAGNPEYFDVNAIVSAMLAVVQEQQQIIDDLTNRMIQLESQLGG